MKRMILFSLTTLLLLSAFSVKSIAQTMINEDYRVQMGDLDSTVDPFDIESQNIANIEPNKAIPGLIEGKNYKVKSGYQYTPDSYPFSFSISNTTNDFGPLAPTNPVIRSTVLMMTNTETDGYNVSAAENHELTEATTGANIPDTTCDDGKCTENHASAWSNTLTYGFGYRCEKLNSMCIENDNSFEAKDNFKQFSNSSKDESAVSIMSGKPGANIGTTILLKVNTSSSQPAGVYSNVVTFLATPNY